ncbi:MAG: MFS transporter [Pseudomonadota bacterium]
MSVLSLLRDRSFAGLLASNMVLGTAFPIQLILGGLSGLMLAPSPGLATLPSAVQTLAGLVAAAPMSLLMGRLGRRAGFALGAGLTLAAALCAIHALYATSFAWLCAAHFMMGAGWAAFQFFRFAAADAAPPALRPIAISLMLSALLGAALLGPQVFISAKDALAPVPLAGGYAAIGVIALLGVLLLALVRLPRPQAPPEANRNSSLAALRRADVQRAIAIAALAQGIMVFMMIPTPIAIIGCGLSEAVAGDVIRWHIVAMFAPSFVTGSLIQRVGAQPIAITGLVIMVCAAAGAAHGLSAGHFYGALIALGLGWNFGFIGATTLLERALSDAEKPALQGINDTIIALVSTLSAFAAGFVITYLGWALLALCAGAVVVLGLVCLALSQPTRRPRGSPLT